MKMAAPLMNIINSVKVTLVSVVVVVRNVGQRGAP